MNILYHSNLCHAISSLKSYHLGEGLRNPNYHLVVKYSGEKILSYETLHFSVMLFIIRKIRYQTEMHILPRQKRILEIHTLMLIYIRINVVFRLLFR